MDECLYIPILIAPPLGMYSYGPMAHIPLQQAGVPYHG